MKEKGTVPPPYTSPKPSGQAHSVASARTMSHKLPVHTRTAGTSGEKRVGARWEGPECGLLRRTWREQQEEAEQQQATKPFRMCDSQIMVRLQKLGWGGWWYVSAEKLGIARGTTGFCPP